MHTYLVRSLGGLVSVMYMYMYIHVRISMKLNQKCKKCSALYLCATTDFIHATSKNVSTVVLENYHHSTYMCVHTCTYVCT